MIHWLVAASAGVIWCATTVLAEPFTPAADTEIVETLPGAGMPELDALRSVQAALRADPTNLTLAVDLAERHIAIGRQIGDPRYMGYAMAALTPWWDAANPPVAVLILRAELHQNRHRFDSALDDLAAALAKDPRNPRAWLTAAVIHQVRGDYDQAHAACVKLIHLTDRLIAAACGAAVRSLTGQADRAYRILAAQTSRIERAEATVQAWVHNILADVAVRQGRANAAEKHFRDWRALKPRNVHLHAAYADFLLAEERAAELAALLVDVPEADAILLRKAIAAHRLNAPDRAALTARLRTRFAEARLRGGEVHLRARARFALDIDRRPQDALDLALANWDHQREPEDALLVARSALAAGRPDAAAQIIAWARANRFEDVRLAALIDRLEAARS